LRKNRKEIAEMGRKFVPALLLGLVMISLAAPAFAQGEAAPAGATEKGQWLLISAGFGMALAAAGCGYAQSRTLTAACEGVARNPGATDTIRIFTFLGLAFIEFLALLTFVVIMLLLYT
jgi:F-type H+-transporting ATPase subunit c